MERLKKILRLALQEQAQRLKLQAGSALEILTAAGPRQAPEEGVIESEYLQRLYAFLFPSDRAAIATGQPIKGMLTVPNVGRLMLIAQPAAPASLRVYLPPAGQALFESDWGRFGGQGDAAKGGDLAAAPAPAVAAPVMAGAPPLPPPGGARAIGVPTVGAIPHGMLFGPAGAVAPAAAPVHAAGHGAPAAFPGAPQPVPAAADSSAGFIPAGLGLAAIAAPLMQVSSQPMMQPPVMHQAVMHQQPVMQQPLMQQPLMQQPLMQQPLMPQSVMPQPIMPQHQQPLMQQPIMPQPMMAAAPHMLHVPVMQPAAGYAPPPFPSPAAPAAEERPVICFGPEALGEADISDGLNPIDAVLIDMIKRKASDLHMTCGEPLCFRVDGEIERITREPTTPSAVENFLLPIMPMRNQAEFAKINDTDFAYEIRGVGRFRVNVFRDKNGVGSVMRHIPSTILTAEQLGLPPAITKFCQLTKGLVVVTGPTGSGKSTTLAAMVDLINKTRGDHILTIEDPVEFVHPQQKCLVNQREVHKHTGSFSRALKAALREDPDIVLIGEMRDLETVAIAIETAETGHLVFGTLHTNTAVSTIDRIVDQFPTDRQEQIRMMLASSLKGVVAQTLLKKKGGGRCAAHEILVTNDAVSAMIREGKNHMIPNHMQTQKADGNILLNESLLRLVKEGLIDADDAMRKAIDKNALAEVMKRGGIRFDEGTPAPARPGPAKKAG